MAWGTTSTGPARCSGRGGGRAAWAGSPAAGSMSTLDLMAPEVAEQRREIVAMARDFAAREITPHAAEWDRVKAMPREVLARLGELGFFGLRIPEEYGGLGLDALTYLMVLEGVGAAHARGFITLRGRNS